MRFFSRERAAAIFSKECKHILRDPFTLIIALLLPLAIVLILGNSIEFNIRSIKMAYYDADRTESSRELIDTFGSSDYFKTYPIDNPDDGFNEILAERARAVLVVSPNFEREIFAGRTGNVQVMVDGADNSSIIAITNYMTTINTNAATKILKVDASASPLSFKSRYLFNPELNSRWFSVPGLSAAIIALVAIMLTTLTICREWEKGSMEMLGHISDTLFDNVCVAVSESMPINNNAAIRCRQQSAQHAYGCCFPSTVRAQEPKYFPTGNLERYIAHGTKIAKTNIQI